MLKILIPMAGAGSRFSTAGYALPKPFIDVEGRPMIQRVVENVMPLEPHQFIFIVRKEHESLVRKHMSFATHVIYTDGITEGAACTALLAREFINEDDSLLIANSDQLCVWNNCTKVQDFSGFYWRESNCVQDFINASNMYLGGIACFYSQHPKWSYVRLKDGLVVETAEKRVISNLATCGVYYFARGHDFIKAAEKMIAADRRTNGEFYICPVFNELVSHATIVPYMVRDMISLGTPEDLQEYLERRQ